MTPFSDLPAAKRIALRKAIESHGGVVAGFQGPFVQVAIPRPCVPFVVAMRQAGLELDQESLHHFPLGSDNPPDYLRHSGNYPGSKGFWLYGRFFPNS